MNIQEIDEQHRRVIQMINDLYSAGKPGTVRLVEKYGDDLLCVRYRDDTVRKRNVKTVVLIVAESPYHHQQKECISLERSVWRELSTIPADISIKEHA